MPTPHRSLWISHPAFRTPVAGIEMHAVSPAKGLDVLPLSMSVSHASFVQRVQRTRVSGVIATPGLIDLISPRVASHASGATYHAPRPLLPQCLGGGVPRRGVSRPPSPRTHSSGARGRPGLGSGLMGLGRAALDLGWLVGAWSFRRTGLHVEPEPRTHARLTSQPPGRGGLGVSGMAGTLRGHESSTRGHGIWLHRTDAGMARRHESRGTRADSLRRQATAAGFPPEKRGRWTAAQTRNDRLIYWESDRTSTGKVKEHHRSQKKD
ncbi:hypothetical protein JB92DRAFT_2833707 [Gautieria morchelliformis]|nr:hypothetical protein JB92DRAFT_2833707 [Gautieria morchelliformis]